jgi:Copper amine oxidase N-terminal domain
LKKFLPFLILVLLYPARAGNLEQAQNTLIVVNGRTLTGANSSPQQRNGRLFLPVAGIARELGDAINVEAQTRVVTVRRQTGITADFNANLNQVRENGSVVLVVSNASEIVFPPNAEELMLPVEIVSELLGASVHLDETANAVIVTRGQTPTENVRNGARHSIFELYQINYEYNLNRFDSATNQNLILNASGRIADGRFTLLSNLSGSLKNFNFRNGTFIFERPNEQRFIVGDFGSGTDLQFMSATVRGASVQIPVRNFSLTAFGGRSSSGEFFALPFENRKSFQYDTNIFGVYATFGNNFRAKSFSFSTGVMRFDAPLRKGEMLTASFQKNFNRLRVQLDAAFGNFSGYRKENERTSGFGAAFDVSASYQMSDNLTFQGRFAYVGKNFFSAQSGQREPVRLAAGGVVWQPKKWLTASVSGSTATRFDNNSGRERFLTAAFNLTPRNLPNLFFSHTESSTPQLRRASFTLLNASKEFSRWRIFINASRIKTIGEAFVNAMFGTNFRVNDSNSIEVSQSFGNRGNLSGNVDWQTSNLLSKRLSFSAGFGYNRSNSTVTTTERVSANLRLPRQNLFQISYLQNGAGATLLFSLRGTLFKKRAAEIVSGVPVSEINSYGSFSGRVYQDTNLNGKYDADTDKPQANVKVRVDGNRYVESDANGLFKIDGVKTGEHRIYIDLLSVRADLTLLDGDQQRATLASGRDSIVDFRLVRTGRITGTIWLDANENGKFDAGEATLANVRVAAGSGRDTLTDSNGVFVLGDLPPGEHTIFVDEKTLPEKMKSALSPLSVKVLAGRETAEINFPVTSIPAEVKRFSAKKSN